MCWFLAPNQRDSCDNEAAAAASFMGDSGVKLAGVCHC